MRKMFVFLLMAAMLSPAALAHSHVAVLPDMSYSQLMFNDAGEIVVPIDEYDLLLTVDGKSGFFAACRDDAASDTYALMDDEGELLTGEVYRSFAPAYADRVVFSQKMPGGRFYDLFRILFSIPKGTKDYYGILNEKGEEIVPAAYLHIGADGAGGFWAQRPGSSKLVHLDHDGNPTYTDFYIATLRDNWSDPFAPGTALLPATETPDGPTGFLNADLEWEIPPQFAQADSFADGFASVYDQFSAKVDIIGKRGLIDETGKIVVPIQYDSITCGSVLIARPHDTEIRDVYSHDGELLFSYDGLLQRRQNLLYGWPASDDSVVQLLDLNGNVLRSAEHDEGTHEYLLTDSSVNRPTSSDDASEEHWYLMDAQGNSVGRAYSMLHRLGTQDGRDIYAVGIGRFGEYQIGLVDEAGDKLTPLIYSLYLPLPDDNFIVFQKNTGFDVVDFSGNVVLQLDSEGNKIGN